MSLVDKFSGRIGDFVVFYDQEDFDHGINFTGYVIAYSDKEVRLSNRSCLTSDGSKRNLGVLDTLRYEKRVTALLKDWNSYEIKDSFEEQRKRLEAKSKENSKK